MEKKSPGGWRRLINATIYSMRGIRSAWRNETAFRQEVIGVIVFIIVAFPVGRTMTQRAVLILSIVIILIVELLNSAIESVIDRIGPEHHPLSARAKNMGSAAVLLSLIAAVVVWGLVVFERWVQK